MKNFLKLAILMVNGRHNHKDRLWLEISLGNLVRHISDKQNYRVFIWNHHFPSAEVSRYLDLYKDKTEVLDEQHYDIAGNNTLDSGKMSGRPATFAGGYHVHRTPLQILYDHAVSRYDVDIVVTFDSDACPIRYGWDIQLTAALDTDIRLAGIWRDEMSQAIEPYVHPACLAIKTSTIRELGLRFDRIPNPVFEDSLSHFTAAVREYYGPGAIYPLKRNNAIEFHPVFNGIYGSLLYHHHFGTRNAGGQTKSLKSFGYRIRRETMTENRLVMDGTTEMLFRDPGAFFNLLTYGNGYTRLQLYENYLKAFPSRFRCYRLLGHAIRLAATDPAGSFFILTLVHRELQDNPRFMQTFISACEAMGLTREAGAYRALLT
ncbi:MAG: hypothetical protein WCO44_17170 [Bacteroidota bacterium]